MALNATYASTPCFVHELLNEIYAPSCHPPIEAARAVAKLMYHNDRVLRVMLVANSAGSFVEWIER